MLIVETLGVAQEKTHQIYPNRVTPMLDVLVSTHMDTS